MKKLAIYSLPILLFLVLIPLPVGAQSPYFVPEVLITDVKFLVHEGLGWFHGPVEHYIEIHVWTNVPQTITLMLRLYNVSSGKFVGYKTVQTKLFKGSNVIPEWITVSAPMGGCFKVLAEIIKWEYDTDTRNNAVFSNTVFLKPFVDLRVFIMWRIVHCRSVGIIPGDTIEIMIGVETTTNTTSVPARLKWEVDYLDPQSMNFKVLRRGDEEIRARRPSVIWRNITITIPNTTKIIAKANATHPWECMSLNNYADTEIEVGLDARIELLNIVTYPESTPISYSAKQLSTIPIKEDSQLMIILKVWCNDNDPDRKLLLSVSDESTYTILKQVNVAAKPEQVLRVTVQVPENPIHHWFLKDPYTIRDISVVLTGDLYEKNNIITFSLKVESTTRIVLSRLLQLILLIIIPLVVVTLGITIYRKSRRKSSLTLRSVTATVHPKYKHTLKYCPKCGFPLESGYKFCPNCGFNIQQYLSQG